MCAGELRPSEGDAHVAGHSVTWQTGAARQELGYCPQVLKRHGKAFDLRVLASDGPGMIRVALCEEAWGGVACDEPTVGFSVR